MKTLTEQFLDAIDGYLTRTGTKPSDFERQAIGDPSLVLSLRRGRSPTLATADKILAFIRAQEQVGR
jgi:predicted transcriptional regulator